MLQTGDQTLFWGEHYVTIVGITGPIPVTPNISSSRKLRSALIDKHAKTVRKDVWHAYHNAKAPD